MKVKEGINQEELMKGKIRNEEKKKLAKLERRGLAQQERKWGGRKRG